MSAELFIHCVGNLTEEEIARFFAPVLGSKHFNLHKAKFDFDLAEKVHDTDAVRVGEVSWAKALALGGKEEFIPSAIERVHEIVGEDLPVIDDELIERIHEAMALENATEYDVAAPELVREFLVLHRGERIFTVSW